jgi:tight adherence protein C
MAILAAFLVAVLVAALLYEGLPVAASVRVEQYETVAGLRPAGQGRLPFWRAVLVPFNRLGRYLPSSLAGRARRQLYWAQRAGAWVGWDEASFLGLRLAGAVVGFLLTASAPMGILVAGAFLGWWLPGMMLAGRARRVERAFRRELPDVAHLLSMLVSAGLSVEQALERIAAQRGLVAGWLGEGLAQSRGQRRMEVLLRRAEETGLVELVNFVAQLGEMERAGTGVEGLLDGLAQDMSTAYRAEALRRAKVVGSQLILPILAFYLLPYLVAIGAPMVASMLRLFQ